MPEEIGNEQGLVAMYRSLRRKKCVVLVVIIIAASVVYILSSENNGLQSLSVGSWTTITHIYEKKHTVEPHTRTCPPEPPTTDKSCEIFKPDQSDCALTEKLFFSEPTETCDGEPVELCQIAVDKSNTRYKALCRFPNTLITHIIVTYQNKISGITEVIKIKPENSQYDLPLSIDKIVDETQHTGYLFIHWEVPQRLEEHSQLLIIPPGSYLTPSIPIRLPTDGLLNINIIFIDSVSYYHFQRSLLRTVATLHHLTNSHLVLEFTQFQSIKARTFESLEALFWGKVNVNETFGILSMPNYKLKLQGLFKPFSEKGYDTMFMEDLCWLWEWGLSKDLLVHNKNLMKTPPKYWNKLVNTFKQTYLNNYGISSASCDILKRLGRPDPFHGLPSLCYNGRYQHDYMFDYLSQYQNTMHQVGAPYFTFYMNNVGHDEWGRRVQTLDGTLSQYLMSISEQSNTLTILLSDHGNTYGEFVKSKLGAREMFHPFLYMILPENAQKILGKGIVDKLRENEHHLLTTLHIHPLLHHIATGQTKTTGVLQSIEPTNDCRKLELFQPNRCICENKQSIEKFTDSQLKQVAEFASGMLNNHIEKEHLKFKEKISYIKLGCRMLYPIKYENVIYVQTGETTISVTMDIFYLNPNTESPTEIITVIVTCSIDNSKITKLHLVNINRKSAYAPYKYCAKHNIEICICTENEDPLRYASHWENQPQYSSPMIGTIAVEFHGNCLMTIIRVIDSNTFSLYLGNRCYDKVIKYQVKKSESNENGVILTRAPPIEGELPVLRQTFLSTGSHKLNRIVMSQDVISLRWTEK